MASRIPASCRCVYTTPLAGPVEPEVYSTAASASGTGEGNSTTVGVGMGSPSRPSAEAANTEPDTPSSFSCAAPSGSTEMRLPGQSRVRAAVNAAGIPIRKLGLAPFSARVRPAKPRPVSATTMTAPSFRQA